MSLPAPIAYVSKEREILVLDREGRTHNHTLDLDGPIMWGTWQLGSPKPAPFSWPTWSPDGRNLACFRLPSEQIPRASVFVHDVGGVSSMELLDLGERLPIYLHWAPDGRQVGVLSQKRDRLQLSTVRLEAMGHEITLAEGSPLFFTWADAGHVAAYVGALDSSLSQIALIDSAATESPVLLPGPAGSFCAPLCLDEKVVYVTQEDGHTRLVHARAGDARPTVVEELAGLVALVASPDGRAIAMAVAPDGDGTPYRHITLVDLDTSETREIADLPCLAFQWVPGGEHLVVARVDTERNLLEWLRLDLDGGTQALCSMYPTRDLGFYLRFFEQYVQSHPLVDPTGRYLLLAGTMEEAAGNDNTPRIWRLALDGSETVEIDDGLFAVWGPPASPL